MPTGSWLDQCMTKTEATRKTNQTLSYGHFSRNQVDHYLRCPDCRVEVPTVTVAWAKAGEVRKALRSAMVEHLTSDCEGIR